MSLMIEFLDGDRKGEVLSFEDSIITIAIGRDPERCQVVLPPDLRMVGREHCTINRVRGHYYMEMAADRRVTMNRDLMETAQVLESGSTLQLGPDGPQLRISIEKSDGLAPTLQQGMDPEEVRRRGAAPASAADIKEVQSTAQKGNQRAVSAVIVAIVVLVIAGVWFFMLRDNLGNIEEQQAKQGSSVTEMQGAVDTLSDEVTKLGGKLSDALAAAQASTYVVIRVNPDGLEEPFGTAWVLGPGELATNGHVAARFNELSDGQSLIVRSNGGESTFEVTGTLIHPGYDAFTDLWTDYVPVQIHGSKESDPIRSAGMAADVGVLYVSSDDQLGKPLMVAPEASQQALQAGDVVGYVGYPVEDMALGGINLQEPVPQTQIGYITAVTDYFNTPGADQPGLLIQHSLPGTGGASGAPLLNANGEVVGLLSAVNFIVVGNERIPSGIDVNFAQRSSLLEELQAGDLSETQAKRTAGWEQRIQQLYASGRVMNRSPELDDVIAGWEQMVSSNTGEVVLGSEVVSSDLFPIDSLQIDAFAMGAGDELGAQIFSRSVEMQVDAGKDYLLTIEGQGEVKGRIDSSDIRVTNTMNIKPRLKAIAFRAERSGKIKAHIGTTDASGTLGYQLRSANVTKATPEAVAEAATRRWLQDLSRRDGDKLESRRIRQWKKALKQDAEGRGEALQTIEIDAAGRWFIIAVSTEFQDINLRVSDTDGTLIAEDTQQDWYPFTAIETRDKKTVEVRISSPDPKTEYQLYLYRAVPVSGS
jgi:hypothetical protein